jgi:hypothetical protein
MKPRQIPIGTGKNGRDNGKVIEAKAQKAA